MSSLDKYKDQIPSGSSPPDKPGSISARNQREMPDEKTSPMPDPANNPGSFLVAMLQLSPFFGLFEYVAGRCCSGKSLSLQVSKLKSAHPWWFQICFATDFVFRMGVSGVLVSSAAYAIYKVIVK